MISWLRFIVTFLPLFSLFSIEDIFKRLANFIIS